MFKDNSLSAWNPKVVRPEWNQLMARLETGASDGVMVYDLTRFSRKIGEGERLVELDARGLRVWALAGEYDLTTADGRRHFREAMVAAAGESDKISERVKRGKVRRARKGRHHGGGRPYAMPGNEPAPPGWEIGDPRERTPDDRVAAERAVVVDCYERLFGGESVSSVIRDLNTRVAAGERAALPVSGVVWRRGVFVRSLCRPALAGLLIHNQEIVGERARHPRRRYRRRGHRLGGGPGAQRRLRPSRPDPPRLPPPDPGHARPLRRPQLRTVPLGRHRQHRASRHPSDRPHSDRHSGDQYRGDRYRELIAQSPRTHRTRTRARTDAAQRRCEHRAVCPLPGRAVAGAPTPRSRR